MILKGYIKVPCIADIKSKLSEIKSQIKGTGSPFEVGESLSTVDYQNFKPHKILTFSNFYSQLYKFVLKYHLESDQNSFVRPHIISKVFDTGFNCVDYLDTYEEFMLKYEKNPNYYNTTITENLFLIDDSWINVHWKSGKTLPHTHGDSIKYVCTYYLSAKRNSGRFPFKYKNEWESISVKTGDFLIFPSKLLHSTEENNSDEQRITITTNITLNEYGH